MVYLGLEQGIDAAEPVLHVDVGGKIGSSGHGAHGASAQALEQLPHLRHIAGGALGHRLARLGTKQRGEKEKKKYLKNKTKQNKIK
jgi:hypothetical protein